MADSELDSMIMRYNAAAKKLADSAGSSALSTRRGVEQEYALAAKKLMRAGYLYNIKRKYTNT